MADIILHRRSFDTGSVPTTASLGVAQFAINVPDGKVFIHKSSSVSESIVSVVTTDSITTGSITLTATASAALFIGTFSGSFVGVDTSLISSGSASAAMKYDISGSSSLQINTETVITGSLSVSTTSSAALFVGRFSGSFVGVDTSLISSGSASAAIKYDVSGSSSLQINTETIITGSLLVSGGLIIGIFDGTSSYATTADKASQVDIKVQNKTGATIPKGKIVRVSGSVGDNPLITTASYSNEMLSHNAIGFTLEDIANDGSGSVITQGVITGVNTSGFTSGDQLYLGDTGSYINTPPTAPLHGVRVGEVLRVHASQGSILVRIDNGYELGELHDIIDNTTTASFGDLLVKSGSAWINNKTLTGSYTLSGSINLYHSASVSGTNIFGTASWADKAFTASYVQFQYSRELHVSVGGSDSTGDGTFLLPFRTISKALHSASAATQIVVHPGTYAENPTVSGSASNVTITATNAEIGGIVEISGSLTINQYSASTKIVGLAINNIIHTGSQNLYLQNITVRSGVLKTGNGYLEATRIGCQSPANFNVSASGIVVIQNSLVDGLVVNNASATVNLLNNIAVTAPSCSSGILSIDGGVVYSQHVDSGSVFSGVGAVVSLANVLCLTPTNTSASIKLSAFSGNSIKNVTYNKADSTLGVSLDNKSHFQQLQADGFTGSFFGTASFATTASYVLTSTTASYAELMDGGIF